MIILQKHNAPAKTPALEQKAPESADTGSENPFKSQLASGMQAQQDKETSRLENSVGADKASDGKDAEDKPDSPTGMADTAARPEALLLPDLPAKGNQPTQALLETAAMPPCAAAVIPVSLPPSAAVQTNTLLGALPGGTLPGTAQTAGPGNAFMPLPNLTNKNGIPSAGVPLPDTPRAATRPNTLAAMQAPVPVSAEAAVALPISNAAPRDASQPGTQIPPALSAAASPADIPARAAGEPTGAALPRGEGPGIPAQMPPADATGHAGGVPSQQAAVTTEASERIPAQKEKAAGDEQPAIGIPAHTFDIFRGKTGQAQHIRESVPAEKPIFRQLADSLVFHLDQKEPSFEMQLNPRELGQVMVKMAVKAGELVVDIISSNPGTRQLLAASAGDIRSILEQHTGQKSQIVIPVYDDAGAPFVRPDDQNGHGRENQARQQQSRQQDQKSDGRFAAVDFLEAMRAIQGAAVSI